MHMTWRSVIAGAWTVVGFTVIVNVGFVTGSGESGTLGTVLAGFGALTATVIAILSTHRFGLPRRSATPMYLLFVYGLLGVASASWSDDAALSLSLGLQFCALVALAVAAAAAKTSLKQPTYRLFLTLLVAAMAMVVIAPERAFLEFWEAGAIARRLGGVTHPNALAGIAASMVAIRHWHSRQFPWRALLVAVPIVYWTGSRTGLACLLAITGVSAVAEWRARRGALGWSGAVLMLVGLLSVVVYWWVDAMHSLEGTALVRVAGIETFSGRPAIWALTAGQHETAFDVLAGRGFVAANRELYFAGESVASGAHNGLLEAYTSVGLVGLGALVFALVSTAWVGVRAVRRGGGLEVAHLAVLLIPFLLVSSAIAGQPGWTLVVLLVGLTELRARVLEDNPSLHGEGSRETAAQRPSELKPKSSPVSLRDHADTN